jgi:hypothetical protein
MDLTILHWGGKRAWFHFGKTIQRYVNLGLGDLHRRLTGGVVPKFYHRSQELLPRRSCFQPCWYSGLDREGQI